ncbi:hypothetical protein NTGM5_300006 [Candidatus Nitrotoga sp. M5]|nr:hypothetical protein NTGM5_300006 [Candidatus Nitrotoga sp. M5]
MNVRTLYYELIVIHNMKQNFDNFLELTHEKFEIII